MIEGNSSSSCLLVWDPEREIQYFKGMKIIQIPPTNNPRTQTAKPVWENFFEFDGGGNKVNNYGKVYIVHERKIINIIRKKKYMRIFFFYPPLNPLKKRDVFFLKDFTVVLELGN